MATFLWTTNNDSSLLNESHPNYTMHEKTYNTLCSVEGAKENSSVCNKSGLGLSLSTPILMLSFGVLGNMIALIVLYTVRKEMKTTVFYTLLFGLGVTDLIGQLLTGPIAIIVYANNLQWVGGEPLCKYHAFCMIAFGMITPIFVCAMSFERLLALRFAYFHARVVTRKKARVVILLCWMFVIFFCSLPFMGFGSYEHQFPGSWCFLNFHRESKLDMAYAYLYAILNIIFILTIITCNSVVVLTLLKMRRTRVLNNSPSIERRQGVKPKTKMKFEEETQMVWFLCAITLVFSTCYLPLNINILINQITGRVNYAADLLGVRMASINQILDPWLYILLRKRVIVKVVLYVANLIFCRRSVAPRINRCLYSSSQGNNSYTNMRQRNHSHELKHFDSERNGRESVSEDPGGNKTFTGNKTNNQSDRELSDCSVSSTHNLINAERDLHEKTQNCFRGARSRSLDRIFGKTEGQAIPLAGQGGANYGLSRRKSSIQSFLRAVQCRKGKRKQSLPAKFNAVGNNSV